MEKNLGTAAFVIGLLLICAVGQDTADIDITFVSDGEAVCLDGSPGAYFYDRGTGEGSNNLLVYLEGGGWCESEKECVKRSRTGINNPKNEGIGTNLNRTHVVFQTILSPYQHVNPDFFNWHRVFISYCDGASFLADREATKANLYLRGARILKAAILEVVAAGDIDVENGILVGESAGGLAALLNCDRFRSFFPSALAVKCIADSGFFINVDKAARRFSRTTAFHELAGLLPKPCAARMDPSLCFFPENFIGDLQIPLFILNSVFDSMQLKDVNPPLGDDPNHWYSTCQASLNCTVDEVQVFKEFRASFLRKLNSAIGDNPASGVFMSTCFLHDILNRGSGYFSNLTVGNQSVASAIGDWYFKRSHVRLINETDVPSLCG